eukprot:CAMPEP_0174737618 /NCGR_PEP_ID=MMETSP1094-20130205/68592_1 /TAXON_ID=156173 /ORGANISM="Chrysochromulina brevifilum, Strain UTEX LB 985" /LENGTH=71 /DNA_ID=CAMNT_0015940873 /DNA_START=303 /DNA_END=514 /DNA_ORIENTATION=-
MCIADILSHDLHEHYIHRLVGAVTSLQVATCAALRRIFASKQAMAYCGQLWLWAVASGVVDSAYVWWSEAV